MISTEPWCTDKSISPLCVDDLTDTYVIRSGPKVFTGNIIYLTSICSAYKMSYTFTSESLIPGVTIN